MDQRSSARSGARRQLAGLLVVAIVLLVAVMVRMLWVRDADYGDVTCSLVGCDGIVTCLEPPLTLAHLHAVAGTCRCLPVEVGETVPLSRGEMATTTPTEEGCLVELGPLPGRALVAAGLPLDPNRATAEDLTVIPGIGPALAQAIVTYRDSFGSFESVCELSKVKGIGPKTLEKVAPYLDVEK